MFDADVRSKVTEVAEKHQVEPAALLAVVDVESAGKAYATVDDALMPLIRWEGHYFYRLLPDHLKKEGVKRGLAYPKWGVIKNPKTQQARYNLLARAKTLHEEAALGSCSWGVGQVMGSHWKWLGYPSVQALVDEATSGVTGQVELMMRFIISSKLVDELQRRDFYSFARVYNGPGQVDYYGSRMKKAYARYAGSDAPDISSGLLRIGSHGEEVRELQLNLRRLGYHLIVDGDFGPATRAAVVSFQTDYGLNADGIVGPLVWSVIERLQGVSDAA